MKSSIKSTLVLCAALGYTAAHGQSPAHGPGYQHGTGPGYQHGTGAGYQHGMRRQGAMQGGAGHGPMAGPRAMLTKQDAGSAADMDLVHQMLMGHDKIRRTVTRLPDGIRTVTESDDPQLARVIKVHVASMSARLNNGQEFNIFSTTLPVLFDHADKLKSNVELTAKGAIVTRVSSDPAVVAALQAHAAEVSELVRDGMAGFHRGMQARMAMGPAGPRGSASTPHASGDTRRAAPVAPAPGDGKHAH